MTTSPVTLARTLTLFCVAAGLATLGLAACGSGSTPKTAGSSTPGAQATAPTTSTTSTTTTTTQATTSSGAPQSAAGAPDLATKGCTGIKIADAQAVVKAMVSKVDFSPGTAELDPGHAFQCSVNNPTLIIAIHPEDPSTRTYDQDVADENAPAVPLPGIGEAAVWTAVSLTPGKYTAAPDVYAHKGAITCEVKGSGQGLAIAFEPGPIPAIYKADVAAFAAKLGVLCNDVFTALA